ncbi:protein-disulfide reductase DsbD family protein [Luteolibacter sp. SL250]|uniref:protein-disulfide reductase DsbD family protein n=1 Tax=Luteolibacter sp. SL250 TaxID=2995170 RepID=UPI0022714DF2|nr:thioredoxin family protein [Luteolibacter sp. SL250]WAC21381.1 protein-disulfide reductase DsbD family protein [Luteolibacter sp. SL250]
MPRLLAALFLLFGCSLPALAQFKLPGGTSSTTLMVPETSTIAPGKPFTVALKLTHPAEWHSYYKNSGGIEKSPTITWTLPEGFSAGPIQWPVPELKDLSAGDLVMKSLIYSGSPVFLVDITPPATLTTGTPVTLTAKAEWQICKTACIDESATFTLKLPVADAPVVDAAHAALFTAARQALPATNQDWKAAAKPQGDGILLTLTPVSEKAKGVQAFDFLFIPDQQFIVPVTANTGISLQDGAWQVPLKRRTEQISMDEIPQEDAFSGILVSKSAAFPPVAIGTISLKESTATPAPADATVPAPDQTLLVIIGGMFLGGLILNLMPCVFPVIGLKISGFVQQAGHDRRKIVLHGLIFTLGVLISFWLLALALYLGGITSWGNQLQDPRVSFIAIVIMLLLGMNLFGVFEIGTSATGVGGDLARKSGIAGTFFSGVLATLVATPCSGPFLGTAIGAAARLPAVPFFIAFTFMGLGLSLPYLVLSAFPALIEKLPRPGAWMESFKQGMSFLLFATAGYFLWVYGAQVFDHNEGQKGLWVMIGISIIACAAWIYGRWSLPYRTAKVRIAARIIALAFAATGTLLAWPWPVPTVQAADAANKLEWHPWSQEEVERLLAAGQPVYVDFTAKWCLTCQVNKSRAYTPDVVKLMKDKNIVALKADKTNTSPAIDAKLKELGRTAIPVNVLYIPGQPEPVITPELLSPEVLKEIFGKIP